MQIIDCAQTLEPHWLWETTPFVSQAYSEGDEFQEFGLKWFGSGFSFVSAPGWKNRGGARLDAYALECFAGVANVIDLTGSGEITAARVEQSLAGRTPRAIVVLKTGHADAIANRRPHYWEKAPIVPAEVADFLAAAGCRHVCVDVPCDSFAGRRPGGEGAIANRNEQFRSRCHALGMLVTENCAGLSRLGAEAFFCSLPIRGDGLTTAPCRPIALPQWPNDHPRLFDISTPLMNHWRWKLDIYAGRSFEAGDDRDETHFVYGGHGFTHCDAPRHMEKAGPTMQDLANGGFDRFVGPAFVIDLSDLALPTPITHDLLMQRSAGLEPGRIIVLRSDLTNRLGYGSRQWHLVAPSIEPSAARWLVEQRPLAIALDFPQDFVARQMPDRHVYNREFVVHHEILGHGVPFIEDLRDIGEVGTREPMIMAVPLKMTCVDGAPMRVIAIDWS